MRPFNALDPNVAELPRGMTAGALLQEALWSSAHVRELDFAITTRHGGSLVLSREMAMSFERENKHLRFALETTLSKLEEFGTAWHYERPLVVALVYGRQVLAQSAGYDFRYTDRRYFPRDLQPKKRARVVKNPHPKR